MRKLVIVLALAMSHGAARAQEPSGTPATEATAEIPTPPAEAPPVPPAEAPPSAQDAEEAAVLPAAEKQSPASPVPTESAEVDVISVEGMPDLSLPDDALEPQALVPDMPPPAPVTPESVVERQRELLIRYREARVKWDKDPAVASLRDKADKARTPEGRRAALREYYRLLHKKIAAADAELQETCRAMEDAYLRRLAQTRIEPTIPLEPPPTPEPLN